MSWFASVASRAPDPIFGLNEEFKADLRKGKLNLSIGTYRDAHLQPFIFRAVKQAEEYLWKREVNKEYLPIAGDPLFLERIGKLLFGTQHWSQYGSQIAALQTAGGTGALRIGADFLKTNVQGSIFLPTPTWPNHHHVMMQSGLNIGIYPYYDTERHEIDFQHMLHFLDTLPPSSIILFHLSCHNPSGFDPTLGEWKMLSQLMLRKKLFPFFDAAYQGFGIGIAEDVEALRPFIDDGHEFLVVYSCSKNFSLYCERVGALFIFTKEEKIADAIVSNLRMMTRGLISNPPAHGARIVSTILDTPLLYDSWKEELEMIRSRIQSMRRKLVKMLGEGYNFIEKGTGLFCITGLSAEQTEKLKTEYAIYMTRDGRISLAGLNDETVDILVHAMQQIGS